MSQIKRGAGNLILKENYIKYYILYKSIVHYVCSIYRQESKSIYKWQWNENPDIIQIDGKRTVINSIAKNVSNIAMHCVV